MLQARTHKLDVVPQRDRATGETYYILNGSQRFVEGYLQRTVNIKGLIPEETLPPLDELQRYNAVGGVGTLGGGKRQYAQGCCGWLGRLAAAVLMCCLLLR